MCTQRTIVFGIILTFYLFFIPQRGRSVPAWTRTTTRTRACAPSTPRTTSFIASLSPAWWRFTTWKSIRFNSGIECTCWSQKKGIGYETRFPNWSVVKVPLSVQSAPWNAGKNFRTLTTRYPPSVSISVVLYGRFTLCLCLINITLTSYTAKYIDNRALKSNFGAEFELHSFNALYPYGLTEF